MLPYVCSSQVGIVLGVLGLGIPFLLVPRMEPSAQAYLEDEEKKKTEGSGSNETKVHVT